MNLNIQIVQNIPSGINKNVNVAVFVRKIYFSFLFLEHLGLKPGVG